MARRTSIFGQRFAGPPITPAVLWIIVATTAAFVVIEVLRASDSLFTMDLLDHLILQPLDLFRFGPQGLMTLVLVHDGPLHLFFAMLVLYSVGPLVERAVGSRRFLWLYLASALSGSVLYCLVSWVARDHTPTLGSSGAIFGVIAAFSILFPEAQVRVWFTSPLRAANVIWLALAVDIILKVVGVHTALSVHVGGTAFAFVLLRRHLRPMNPRHLWLLCRKWWIQLKLLRGPR